MTLTGFPDTWIYISVGFLPDSKLNSIEHSLSNFSCTETKISHDLPDYRDSSSESSLTLSATEECHCSSYSEDSETNPITSTFLEEVETGIDLSGTEKGWRLLMFLFLSVIVAAAVLFYLICVILFVVLKGTRKSWRVVLMLSRLI